MADKTARFVCTLRQYRIEVISIDGLPGYYQATQDEQLITSNTAGGIYDLICRLTSKKQKGTKE